MSHIHNFCNNCGNLGHAFHHCKKPITSIGTIVYKRNENLNTLKYLLICRKDTLGFVDFMRGKYILNDKSYIQNIINEMTNDEKHRLMTFDFNQLWKQLWGNTIGIQYRGEENISKDKFNKLKEGIIVGGNKHTLESLIKSSNTSWTEPEWGFPKGRRNYKEKDITCALREFEEETGYLASDLVLIQNLIPFEEVFTGSNNKSYKHCYFLAEMIKNKDATNEFQETEVSAISWVTYDEAKNKIRSYNLEKIEILTRVNTLLREYRIYV